MPARDEAGRLGQHADLLAAPAGRRLGVGDRQRPRLMDASRCARRAGDGRLDAHGDARAGQRPLTRGGRRVELDPVQPRIDAAAREQLGVRALLDDAAVVEHDDAVGVLDRRQPVRDDDRRAAAASACRAPPAPGARTRSRARRSPRRGSGSARSSGSRARSRCAGAARPTAARRSRRPRVSKPCGIARMNSSACAAAAARSIVLAAACRPSRRRRCWRRSCRRTAARPATPARSARAGSRASAW